MENTTNSTMAILDDEKDIPLFYTISYCAIFPLICTIGIVGNILTTMIVCQEKKWTSSASLIISLSISDCLVLVTRLFYVLIRVSEMYLPDPTKLFTMYLPSYGMLNINIYSQKVSKMILVQIGMERLLAVWFPLKTKLLCSPRKTLVFVLFLVCLVSSICIPIIVDIFVKYTKTISEGGEVYAGTSATVNDLIRYYKYITPIYVTLFLVSRYFFDFFPLLFLTISSCLIVVGIKRSALDMKQERRKSQSKQVTKMLACVCFVFVVLCLPNDFLSVALNSFGVTIPGFYYIIADILSTSNNSINFIFYGAFHTTYRNQYKRFLSCMCLFKARKHRFSGSESTSSSSKPTTEITVSYIKRSASYYSGDKA